MARYTGPKNRLARAEGIDLGLKTPGSHTHAQLMRRLNIPPGQHGARGKRKTSEYGLQLREKQRARRMYGILERQFRNYFEQASQAHGQTGEKLLELLERRLDNVVYRLGLAPTRTAARQFVTHGHVLVNGKRVNIPSYQLRIEEVVSLSQKGTNIPVVKELLGQKNPIIPGWLTRSGPAGKIERNPNRDEIEVSINEQLIVEFYSR